jgi:uncharacterized protein with von Willebrand factor type A (vWA) domain
VAPKRSQSLSTHAHRTQYPRDDLAVIVSRTTPGIKPGALTDVAWLRGYGTNPTRPPARRILERNPAVNKEIVVITDGEPTALQDGRVEFQLPADPADDPETLREVQRCTKGGDHDQYVHAGAVAALAEFVAHMTRLNRGRAFYATPEHLGRYVLVDFSAGARSTCRRSLSYIARRDLRRGSPGSEGPEPAVPVPARDGAIALDRRSLPRHGVRRKKPPNGHFAAA